VKETPLWGSGYCPEIFDMSKTAHGKIQNGIFKTAHRHVQRAHGLKRSINYVTLFFIRLHLSLRAFGRKHRLKHLCEGYLPEDSQHAPSNVCRPNILYTLHSRKQKLLADAIECQQWAVTGGPTGHELRLLLQLKWHRRDTSPCVCVCVWSCQLSARVKWKQNSKLTFFS